MQSQTVQSGGIANRVSECLSKFQSITTLVATHPQLQKVTPGFEDQNARFGVYIKNMGADRTGRGSLDSRLQDSLAIRLRVVSFIARLMDLLDDGKRLLISLFSS